MFDSNTPTPGNNKCNIEEALDASPLFPTGPEQANVDDDCPIPFAMSSEYRSVNNKPGKSPSQLQRPGWTGLEQIDDNDTGPVPFTAAASDKPKHQTSSMTMRHHQRNDRPEQFVGDETAPVPFATAIETIVDPDKSSIPKAMVTSRGASRPPPPSALEQIEEDDDGPQPFSMEFESAKDAEKNHKIAARGLEEIYDGTGPSFLSTKEDISAPKEYSTVEDIGRFNTPNDQFESEEKAAAINNKNLAARFRSFLPGTISSRNQDEVQENECDHKLSPRGLSRHHDAECPTYDGTTPSREQSRARYTTPNNTENPDQCQATVLVTEPIAYPVETQNETIYPAEEIPPWWKQRRTKLLLSLICLLVIVVVIAVVTKLSADSVTVEITNNITETFEPLPCPERVLANKQKLGMLLVDPYLPRVVIDGRHAMVVAHGPDANSNFNVAFFSLSINGWERTNVFIEENSDQFYGGGKYSSAISGSTALVGLWKSDTGVGEDADEDAGAVEVYTRDDEGLWRKTNDALVPDDGGIAHGWFGFSVDMDGSLACVAAAWEGAVYVFEQQSGDKWVRVDKVLLGQVVWECLIAGTTLAVQTMDETSNFDHLHIFRYDEEDTIFKPLQDSLPVNGVAVMSEEYLVYSTKTYSVTGDYSYDGVSIYHRQGEQDPYIPLQFLYAALYDSMFGARLAMDGDILVVYAQNTTVIFSEYSSNWTEALILERPYMSYQIAGGNVIAMGMIEEVLPDDLAQGLQDVHYEIHAFNIDDCIQSKAATEMPPNTTSTSSTTLPPECYWAQVNILADRYPGETRWSISRVTTLGGIQKVNFVHGSGPRIDFQVDGIRFDAEHIDNSTWNTDVNGVLCDCGFGTAICECEGKVCLLERGISMFNKKVANCEAGEGLAAVIYNNGGQASVGWTLYPDSADIPAVFISQEDGQYLIENGIGQTVAMVVSGPSSLVANVLNSDRVCLEEGQYQFTIHDNSENGICCWFGKGEYNVTVNGKPKARGGVFLDIETTLFNVP